MKTIILSNKQGYFAGTEIPHAIEPKDKDGKLDGEVIWNYETGIAKRIAIYKNGNLVNETYFYSDGVEKQKGDSSCGCVANVSRGVNSNACAA